MLPRFFKFRFKNVIGHIKLHGHHTYIIICQCPYIGVLAFIKIYKLTGEPVIFTAMRIMSFNKILFIFCICLAADLIPFISSIVSQRDIYIQDHVFVLFFGQQFFNNDAGIFSCRLKSASIL